MLRGFYAICDVTQEQSSNEHVERLVAAAAEPLLAAEPCMLQLRAKFSGAALLWRLAKVLKCLSVKAGVPFCINDRLDVALAIGADAVHLGQDDLPFTAAKHLLAAWPRSMLIGVSTHSEQQAAFAEAAGADYIGFGPVFPTTTKLNASAVVGLERLATVVASNRIPVVGIGGVTLQNVKSVAATGAAAAAVISAVAKAADPVAAGRFVNAAFGRGCA